MSTTAAGDRGRTAAGYAASKSVAEDVVRAAGVPHVILRPSVVVGDSETGEVAAFQGLHHVVAGVFAGMVPMVPFDAGWPIDFLPCDVVAEAIATVVERGVDSGEFWVTAGERALRLGEAMDLTVGYAAELGVRVDAPRFVPPDLFDRLIGPVFLEALPERIRKSVLQMLEFFTTYLRSGATMPSDMDRLAALGMRPVPDLRESLLASVHYWADVKGHCGCARSERRVA